MSKTIGLRYMVCVFLQDVIHVMNVHVYMNMVDTYIEYFNVKWLTIGIPALLTLDICYHVILCIGNLTFI